MSEARFSSGLVLRVVIGAEGFCGWIFLIDVAVTIVACGVWFLDLSKFLAKEERLTMEKKYRRMDFCR